MIINFIINLIIFILILDILLLTYDPENNIYCFKIINKYLLKLKLFFKSDKFNLSYIIILCVLILIFIKGILLFFILPKIKPWPNNSMFLNQLDIRTVFYDFKQETNKLYPFKFPNITKCLQLSLISTATFIYKTIFLITFIFKISYSYSISKDEQYRYLKVIYYPFENIIRKLNILDIEMNEFLNSLLILTILYCACWYLLAFTFSFHSLINTIIIVIYNIATLLKFIIYLILLSIIFSFIPKVQNSSISKLIDFIIFPFIRPIKKKFPKLSIVPNLSSIMAIVLFYLSYNLLSFSILKIYNEYNSY